MPASQEDSLSGSVVDDSTVFTLQDLSRLCAVEEHRLVEYVEEGVLVAVQVDRIEWRFSGGALRRARLALRLQRELELNLAGVALALDLMEEIDRLRREITARP